MPLIIILSKAKKEFSLNRQFDKVLALMTNKLVLEKSPVSALAQPYFKALEEAKNRAKPLSDNVSISNYNENDTANKIINQKKDKKEVINQGIQSTLETVQKAHAKIIKKMKNKQFMKLTHYATCSLGVALDYYSANRGVNLYGLYDVAKTIHPEIGNAMSSVYNPLQHLVKGYMYEMALNIVDKKVTRELERLKAHGHIEDYSHIILAYEQVHHNEIHIANTFKEEQHINNTEATQPLSTKNHDKLTLLADKIYFVRAKKLELAQKNVSVHPPEVSSNINIDNKTDNVSKSSKKSRIFRI